MRIYQHNIFLILKCFVFFVCFLHKHTLQAGQELQNARQQRVNMSRATNVQMVMHSSCQTGNYFQNPFVKLYPKNKNTYRAVFMSMHHTIQRQELDMNTTKVSNNQATRHVDDVVVVSPAESERNREDRGYLRTVENMLR